MSAGAIKDVISFGQQIGILRQINIEWPTFFSDILHAASALDLDFMELPSMQCVFQGTSFLNKLVGTVAGVLGLFLVLFMPSLYARVWRRDVAVQTLQTFKTRASAILLILYAPISRVIISSFRCDDLGTAPG